jgi:hypothetical protein
MRLLLILVCACTTAAQQVPDWQIHLDWSIHDQGHVDCGEQYSPYPTCAVCTPDWKGHTDCLKRGGRACMMNYAIRDARRALRSGDGRVSGYSMPQRRGAACDRGRQIIQSVPLFAEPDSAEIVRARSQSRKSDPRVRRSPTSSLLTVC